MTLMIKIKTLTTVATPATCQLPPKITPIKMKKTPKSAQMKTIALYYTLTKSTAPFAMLNNL